MLIKRWMIAVAAVAAHFISSYAYAPTRNDAHVYRALKGDKLQIHRLGKGQVVNRSHKGDRENVLAPRPMPERNSDTCVRDLRVPRVQIVFPGRCLA